MPFYKGDLLLIQITFKTPDIWGLSAHIYAHTYIFEHYNFIFTCLGESYCLHTVIKAGGMEFGVRSECQVSLPLS